MKKFLFLLALVCITNSVEAFEFIPQKVAVKNLIQSQIRYANKGNFNKFIATYDPNYINADGFNLDVYSKLIKDIWESYNNIKYGVKIKDISIEGNTATVEVTEYSNANLAISKNYKGELTSISESTYYLKKNKGKWKVTSDAIKNETTKMLYGDIQGIDIKLTVPDEIKPNTEYTASLEFEVPKGAVAIASLSSDKVEYPQKPTEEVFRAMPEDNILERLFTSNSENVDEYIVASIGLTKTDICDLSIKMSLTGFGYVIKRVKVIPENKKENINE